MSLLYLLFVRGSLYTWKGGRFRRRRSRRGGRLAKANDRVSPLPSSYIFSLPASSLAHSLHTRPQRTETKTLGLWIWE